MSNSGVSTSWRDKYLQLLDQQEKQEKRFNAQLELLRKGLIQVSLAGEGQDKAQDQILEGLRQSLRASERAWVDQLQKIEARLAACEQRKSQRNKQVIADLKNLSMQLSHMPVGRDLKKELKQLQKDIDTSYPPVLVIEQLLGALRQSQLKVLSQLSEDQSSTSLMQRLFGGAKPEKNSAESQEAGENAFQAESESVHSQSAEADDENIVEGEYFTAEENTNGISQPNGANEQHERHEPPFTKISDHISRVLTELLDHVEPDECVAQKVTDAKNRIIKGLNWFELVPTLEDIRDLIMHAYLTANDTFIQYLQQVNQELVKIQAALGIAQEKSDKTREEIGEKLSQIENSVTNASDLQRLKTDITDHLAEIREVLQEKPANDTEPEQESAGVAEQLRALVTRVQAMEQESAKTREQLEEQKAKAMSDTLTGLPNREAYNERAYHEFKRWERYQHPLSIAVLDIDFFKKINDNYGHQAGDRVLSLIGRSVNKRLREVDFMARYGGEEFVVLLPETTGNSARTMLDKIRAAIAATSFSFKEQPLKVTLSIGVAEFGEGDNVESVFARADKVLYQAKEGGRNLCLLAD